MARSADRLGSCTSSWPKSLILPEIDYPQCYKNPVFKILRSVCFNLNFSRLRGLVMLLEKV
jgi:hypothetical protein